MCADNRLSSSAIPPCSAMCPGRKATSRCTPTSRPAPVAGVAPGWRGTSPRVSRFWHASSWAALLSRLPAAWPGRRARKSSLTRPSTASSTPRWPARRTIPAQLHAPGQVQTGLPGAQRGSPVSLAKGGVENAIGRLRQVVPCKTDLAALSDGRFRELAQACNNTPRKCLGYRTPAEIFLDQVLHLKYESTWPLRRG